MGVLGWLQVSSNPDADSQLVHKLSTTWSLSQAREGLMT